MRSGKIIDMKTEYIQFTGRTMAIESKNGVLMQVDVFIRWYFFESSFYVEKMLIK